VAQDRRLLSYDPASKISQYLTYNDACTGSDTDDTFTIETYQDVSALVEYNKKNFNQVGSLDRWGEGKIVARIPLTLYYQLKREGKLDDQAYMSRWLNSPDNRFFRTRPGRV
jgi:hypothetical protein